MSAHWEGFMLGFCSGVLFFTALYFVVKLAASLLVEKKRVIHLVNKDDLDDDGESWMPVPYIPDGD